MNAEARAHGHGLIWLGTSLAIGLIVSTVLAMGAVERIKLANQTIMVKGCAEKLIQSDVIAWSASFSAQASQLDAAYAKLKNDLSILRPDGISHLSLGVSFLRRAFHSSWLITLPEMVLKKMSFCATFILPRIIVWVPIL